MEKLIGQYRALIDNTSLQFVRYLYNKIDWNSRFIAILGARGVGKTTLLLQRIKMVHSYSEALYVSADAIYFTENKLFDLADTFYKNSGRFLYIDEIHKYPNWSKELKMMYDNLPQLHVVFTGSSILNIYKGSDDLSRRVIKYEMQGLSFREYLNMTQNVKIKKYSLDEILENKVELPDISHPLVQFKEYLKRGYYPFFSEPNYEIRLQNVVNVMLEQDIPAFANMNFSTAQKLKHLMQIIAESVPFKPNFTKISEIIQVHRNSTTDYFHYLERAGLILQLRVASSGIGAIRKVEKVFLENPNLMYALSGSKTNIGNVRECFFYNQMKLNFEVFWTEKGNFKIEEYSFEIGGKQKNQAQVADIKNAFVAKDDIEYGYMNVIPLWHFGMNY
ncbi:MAG TPA: AAA family ATPase [Bacteroidales bacterium]|nr:AAA family ATPase [Bacteroidales bacterium]